MKKLLLLLVTIFLCVGCSKSSIIDQPVTKCDTTTYIPRQVDTLSSVPIEFEVSVTDWESN
jgi:uncharacterized protein YcfL